MLRELWNYHTRNYCYPSCYLQFPLTNHGLHAQLRLNRRLRLLHRQTLQNTRENEKETRFQIPNKRFRKVHEERKRYRLLQT